MGLEETKVRMNRCRELIRTAGQRLTTVKEFSLEEKTSYHDFVTEYDKSTQDFLMTELEKVYPGATFLCEENGVYDISGEYVFIIDPIDGTTNFTKNYRMSSISVALAKEGKLFWGMVYNPFTEELYEALAGEGAMLNGQPIHTRGVDLQHSIVAVGTSPYRPDVRKETFAIAEDVMEYALDIRRNGSAALELSYVAAGRTGVYFEKSLSAWDFAAGMLIVQEAGGIVTDFYGRVPVFTEPGELVAGDRKAHAEFMKRYGKSMES